MTTAVGYPTWNTMRNRCDNPSTTNNPTYVDCTICEEWRTFEVFQKWYIKNHRQGYQLDKDLFIEGNTLYSPETCFFVPQALNLLITPKAKGYVFNKVAKKYQVTVKRGNKRYSYGYYETELEAKEVYRKAKRTIIRLEITKYKELIEPELYKTLELRYKD